MIHMVELTRELAAVIKVACSLCHAPIGHHCANYVASIVWPPHLCRMDAYTHRFDESEDWPVVAPVPVPENLQYVENIEPAKPMLWKHMVSQQLLIHEKTKSNIHEE